MMELLARGQQDNQQWKRTLPRDAAVVVGRDAGSWSVPWEPWISRQHVELRLEDDHVHVRRLSEARNPILFRGEQLSSFSMRAEDCFVIGSTVFTLTSGTASGDSGRSDDEPLMRSFSISREELEHVPFRDAPHRLDVLGHLSKIIFSVTDESELFVQTANLLLEGIRKANVIAIVKVNRNGSSELQILHAEYRVTTGGAFQPSRRLSREAILNLNRSLVHIWNTQQKEKRKEPEMFTLRGDFDWAFCTPLRGAACDGLGIYVAGRLTEGSPDTILIPGQSNDLSEDVKFAELVATIVSALREMQALQHRQSVLSHFFSPSVLRILSTADPETALAPRETEVTVLFCDLRGFSRKVESSSESLSSILDRVSEALGVMSTCILNHKGAIADFLGDCAIGFWGWPLSQKDDVQQACAAALDIQSAFEKCAKQKDHPLFGFEVGVGIGTGRAVAGKIGSRDQAKVTVFGPVVNLASRLEGLTRLLRVPILLDETTAKVVTETLPGTKARCRPLARIKPYGLDSSLIVSELLQPSTETSLLTDQHLAHYRSALSAFLEGRWGDAYLQLHNVPPEDRGKDLLLSFILNHNHTPPPGWDGVIVMQSKN